MKSLRDNAGKNCSDQPPMMLLWGNDKDTTNPLAISTWKSLKETCKGM